VSLDKLWDAVQSGGVYQHTWPCCQAYSSLQAHSLVGRVVATLGWAVECGPLPPTCGSRVAPQGCQEHCLYVAYTSSGFWCTWPCALVVFE
jgi:hypothetical protein